MQQYLIYLDHQNILNQTSYHTVDDFNTFVIAHSYHAAMIKQWKREIENRKDKGRHYLVLGEDTVEIRHDDIRIEVVTAEIPTSPLKEQTVKIAPVTATTTTSFTTKMDIIKSFTYNQQKYAFMIVTSHLDGDSKVHTGIFFDFILTEYH